MVVGPVVTTGELDLADGGSGGEAFDGGGGDGVDGVDGGCGGCGGDGGGDPTLSRSFGGGTVTPRPSRGTVNCRRRNSRRFSPRGLGVGWLTCCLSVGGVRRLLVGRRHLLADRLAAALADLLAPPAEVVVVVLEGATLAQGGRQMIWMGEMVKQR